MASEGRTDAEKGSGSVPEKRGAPHSNKRIGAHMQRMGHARRIEETRQHVGARRTRTTAPDPSPQACTIRAAHVPPPAVNARGPRDMSRQSTCTARSLLHQLFYRRDRERGGGGHEQSCVPRTYTSLLPCLYYAHTEKIGIIM